MEFIKTNFQTLKTKKMNHIKNLGTAVLLLISLGALSQNRNWTIENSKDGITTVKYELIKEDKGTHFHYIAQTMANTSLDELDSYFSNIANHKNFLESTPITKEIEKISENEWLAYYYFDAPWPLPNSDTVLNIKRTRQDNKLIFTAIATSSDYKQKDVERMSDYKVIYEFERIDGETTKITYNADYIPVGSIPKFLIKTWFPEGPANIVTNIGAMK